MPGNAPTFGNRVLIAQRPRDTASFGKKAKEGVFLCWDSHTIQGAFVAVPRKEGGGMNIVVASAPYTWPSEEEKESWRLVEQPEGEERTWVSNKGRVEWKVPEQELVTFKERQAPEEVEENIDLEMHRHDSPEEKERGQLYIGINFGPYLKCPLEEERSVEDEKSAEEEKELSATDLHQEGSDTWRVKTPLGAEWGLPAVNHVEDGPREESPDDAERGLSAVSGGNPRGNNSYKARDQGAVRGTALRTTAAPEVAVQKIEVTRHEKGKEG